MNNKNFIGKILKFFVWIHFAKSVENRYTYVMLTEKKLNHHVVF